MNINKTEIKRCNNIQEAHNFINDTVSISDTISSSIYEYISTALTHDRDSVIGSTTTITIPSSDNTNSMNYSRIYDMYTIVHIIKNITNKKLDILFSIEDDIIVINEISFNQIKRSI